MTVLTIDIETIPNMATRPELADLPPRPPPPPPIELPPAPVQPAYTAPEQEKGETPSAYKRRAKVANNAHNRDVAKAAKAWEAACYRLKKDGDKAAAVTIKAWDADCAAVQKANDAKLANWRKQALDPMKGGLILMIGVKRDDLQTRTFVNQAGDLAGERWVLEQFWKGLRGHLASSANGMKKPTIVGHNVKNFDLKFIRIRALHHGLYGLAKVCFEGWRFDRGPILVRDTYIAVNGGWVGSRGSGKLDDCAELFLHTDRPENPISGKDVLQRFEMGDIAAIEAHMIDDVNQAYGVYLEFEKAGWFV